MSVLTAITEGYDWIEGVARLLVHAEHDVAPVVDLIRADLGLEPIERPVTVPVTGPADPIGAAVDAAVKRALAEFQAELHDPVDPPPPVSLDVGAETAPPTPTDAVQPAKAGKPAGTTRRR